MFDFIIGFVSGSAALMLIIFVRSLISAAKVERLASEKKERLQESRSVFDKHFDEGFRRCMSNYLYYNGPFGVDWPSSPLNPNNKKLKAERQANRTK